MGTELLPSRPSDLVADDRLPPVPLLAGTTRNEGALFTSIFFDQAGTPVTASMLRDMLSRAAGPRANAAGRAYRPGDRSPGRVWSEVITDRGLRVPRPARLPVAGHPGPAVRLRVRRPVGPGAVRRCCPPT